MGKDFRVGLITGVVLAGAALIWVATRPSLGPRARVPTNVQPPETEQTSDRTLPWQELPASTDHDSQAAASVLTTPPAPSNPEETRVPAQTQSVAQEPVRTEPAPLPGVPDLTVYEQAQPIKTTRFHIVQKGDTLSGIAQLYYGSANRWRKILSTNQKIIKDPNKIAPGTKLIIPE